MLLDCCFISSLHYWVVFETLFGCQEKVEREKLNLEFFIIKSGIIDLFCHPTIVTLDSINPFDTINNSTCQKKSRTEGLAIYLYKLNKRSIA